MGRLRTRSRPRLIDRFNHHAAASSVAPDYHTSAPRTGKHHFSSDCAIECGNLTRYSAGSPAFRSSTGPRHVRTRYQPTKTPLAANKPAWAHPHRAVAGCDSGVGPPRQAASSRATEVAIQAAGGRVYYNWQWNSSPAGQFAGRNVPSMPRPALAEARHNHQSRRVFRILRVCGLRPKGASDADLASVAALSPASHSLSEGPP